MRDKKINTISIGERRLLDVACSFGFVVYAATIVVIPICLLDMAEDLDFHLAGGGSLELSRSILLLLTLLFSGHAAAHFGKIRLLSGGAWIAAGGLLLFSFVNSYWMAMFCIMFVGFGSGMLEALINPMVQDLHPKNSGKALNIVNAFFSLGVLISSLLIGEVLTIGINWRSVFQFIALCTAIVAVLFQIGRGAALPRSYSSPAHVADILKRPRFWWFGVAMICAGAAESSFIFWSASFVRLQFTDSPRAGAVATAIFAGSMFIGRIFTGHIAEHIALRRIILLSAVGGAVVSIFVPFVSEMSTLYLLMALAGLFTACFWPSIQSFAADELPVDSTLLFIYLSCFGIPGVGLAGWLIGIVGDSMGIAAGFMLVPVFFIILFLAIWGEQLSVLRMKNKTDKKNR